MSGRTHETAQQHLLLMVESAHRAGRTESEILELLDQAAEADGAELERVA